MSIEKQYRNRQKFWRIELEGSLFSQKHSTGSLRMRQLCVSEIVLLCSSNMKSHKNFQLAFFTGWSSLIFGTTCVMLQKNYYIMNSAFIVIEEKHKKMFRKGKCARRTRSAWLASDKTPFLANSIKPVACRPRLTKN